MSEISSKRIKLDLNINDLYDIIYINYTKEKYDICIKYYENMINNNFNIDYDTDCENNILLIIKICYIKINKYDESLNIFINNKKTINYDIQFYKVFNIQLDSIYVYNSEYNIDLISDYITGYAYKFLNNIEDSIIYFDSSLYKAKENVLINLVKNISSHLIELYENNIDKYFDKLAGIYRSNNQNKKYIELLKTKNMYIDINNYIKEIIDDELNFIFDTDYDVDYYLDNYVINNESDVLYLLEKYRNFGKVNKIKDLINKINSHIDENKISQDLYINVLYEYVKVDDTERLKYCSLLFDLIEKIEIKSDKINNILNEIIEYYNTELYYSNKLGKLKYKRYLNKRNLDNINNNYCKFLNLYKYFHISKIEQDDCVICYDKKDIIKLNCHDSHIVCSHCYQYIDKCPMCRDNIHK